MKAAPAYIIAIISRVFYPPLSLERTDSNFNVKPIISSADKHLITRGDSRWDGI